MPLRRLLLCVEPSLPGCLLRGQRSTSGFDHSSAASSALRKRCAKPHCAARASRGSQSGYTLIEVVIAFALLALGLTLLLGTLSGATRLVRRAEDGGRAALYAQSLLDQIGVGSALQIGHQQGEFENGRYRWALDVAAYVDPGAPPLPPAGNQGARLFELVLSIHWGSDAAQRLQLRSLRFSEPDTMQSLPLP